MEGTARADKSGPNPDTAGELLERFIAAAEAEHTIAVDRVRFLEEELVFWTETRDNLFDVLQRAYGNPQPGASIVSAGRGA